MRVLASATVGIIHIKIFQADSTSVFGENSGTNVNTGADIGGLSMGNTTTNNVGTFWMDDLAASNSGWIGPVDSGGETYVKTGLGALGYLG